MATDEKHPTIQVIQSLLNAGANINQMDIFGLTPLHHAAMRGNVKVAQFLIEQRSIDLEAQDKQKSTPLHIATIYGHSDIACKLIEIRVKTSWLDKKRQNVLHKATALGHHNIVKMVLENASEDEKEELIQQADHDGFTPFLMAVAAGQTKILEIFMECEFEFDGAKKYVNMENTEYECSLHFAVRSGNLETVQILIKNGANVNKPNKENKTPIFLAAENVICEEGSDNIEVIKCLVEK